MEEMEAAREARQRRHPAPPRFGVISKDFGSFPPPLVGKGGGRMASAVYGPKAERPLHPRAGTHLGRMGPFLGCKRPAFLCPFGTKTVPKRRGEADFRGAAQRGVLEAVGLHPKAPRKRLGRSSSGFGCPQEGLECRFWGVPGGFGVFQLQGSPSPGFRCAASAGGSRCGGAGDEIGEEGMNPTKGCTQSRGVTGNGDGG